MQPDSSIKRTVYVTTAAEAADLDAHTVERGTPSAELMRRAGESAARVIESAYGEHLAGGVYVATGPGNNGGDGWIVAGALARRGVSVRVSEIVPPRSEDAKIARSDAEHRVEPSSGWTGEAVVVDALLGTGSTGEPRGEIAVALADMAAARASGARIVALDLPTGLDATTGTATSTLSADLTVTFGTIKRGHLRARERCGRVVITDIGLLDPGTAAALPTLVTTEEAYALVPPIPAAAHKGSRGGVSIVGGGPGMAGAATLAAKGALRSGAGSARICVSDENVIVAHIVVPSALVTPWSRVLSDVKKYLGRWPEAIAIGPGLDTVGQAPELLDQVLANWAGPLVVDADALNLLPGRIDEFRTRLEALSPALRVVLTPHPAEMKRLLEGALSGKEVDDARYDVALEMARRTGAIVLLKGVPTIIAAPDGRRRVSATGTAALATGGAGDVLTGIIATLLAQGVGPFDAAAAGAWMHGRAAELATGARNARGITIEDVVDRLRDVWIRHHEPLPDDVLAELPPIQ